MQLILVRHAQVVVDPTLAVERWKLSPEGEIAALALLQHPALSLVDVVVSSPEPKALATAGLLSAEALPVTEPDLRELDRSRLGWLPDENAYSAVVREILDHPGRSVRGCGRAEDAQRRIVHAIDRIVERYPHQTVAVVSHGIVLTLYVSWLLGLETPSLTLWRSIGFPNVSVVDPERRVVLQPFGQHGVLS